MSYKLTKPYAESDRLDFIVTHNHNNGLLIEETDTALYALEPFEKLVDDEVIDNTEEYNLQLQAEERNRLDMLSLTKREVFLAIYRKDGTTPDQIRAKITDVEAQIEFDYAESYFRGNPLINMLGEELGYSIEDLDYLFEHKEFQRPTISDGSEE